MDTSLTGHTKTNCRKIKSLKKQIQDFAGKGPLVKAMVFPVVMYGCESWTIKKAEP